MPDMDAVLDLVRNIQANNMIDANASFENIMGDKLSDVLANRRVEVAKSIYGPARVDAPAETVEDIPEVEDTEEE